MARAALETTLSGVRKRFRTLRARRSVPSPTAPDQAGDEELLRYLEDTLDARGQAAFRRRLCHSRYLLDRLLILRSVFADCTP